jgi:hypothetical protein
MAFSMLSLAPQRPFAGRFFDNSSPPAASRTRAEALKSKMSKAPEQEGNSGMSFGCRRTLLSAVITGAVVSLTAGYGSAGKEIMKI